MKKVINFLRSFFEDSALSLSHLSRVLGSVSRDFAKKVAIVNYPLPEDFSLVVEGHITEKFNDFHIWCKVGDE